MTLPRQPPRRRDSDDRIDELIDRVGDALGKINVVAVDIAYLKENAKANASSAAEALRQVNLATADLNNSPAGREALSRLRTGEGMDVDQNKRLDFHGERLDKHDDLFRDMQVESQTRAKDNARTLDWVRRAAAAATFVLAVPSTVWMLHLLGVI